MESSSEKMDKSDESSKPSDSVEKVDTDTTENIVQPECHQAEEVKNDINIEPISSNNEINEDIDINDIVLITESSPVIESSVENNKINDPNTVDVKECDIDSIQLVEATENETAPDKCDEEPMDIDEILNSLGADFDTPSSSQTQNVCEESSSSLIVSEKPSELSSIEKGKDEEIVLLSDDDDEKEKNGRFGLNFCIPNLSFRKIYSYFRK